MGFFECVMSRTPSLTVSLLTSSSIPSTVIMPSTPPTSPQRHQEAAHQAERSNCLMASPEQHRTPAGQSAASISAVTPPSIAQASSEQNTLGNLPQHLVAGLQNLIPMPPAPKRGHPSSSMLAPPAVSLVFILIL